MLLLCIMKLILFYVLNRTYGWQGMLSFYYISMINGAHDNCWSMLSFLTTNLVNFQLSTLGLSVSPTKLHIIGWLPIYEKKPRNLTFVKRQFSFHCEECDDNLVLKNLQYIKWHVFTSSDYYWVLLTNWTNRDTPFGKEGVPRKKLYMVK